MVHDKIPGNNSNRRRSQRVLGSSSRTKQSNKNYPIVMDDAEVIIYFNVKVFFKYIGFY